MDAANNYIVKSAAKAIRLLQVLGSAQETELGVSELSRRCTFNKNQTFRLLKTLEEEHFVEQSSATGAYRLGLGLFSLADRARNGFSLMRAAAPVLDRLAVATGETVHLAAHRGLEAVVVDVRESSQNVRLTATAGGRYPLHAGACPQAILAFLPVDEQDQVLRNLAGLPRYTEKTELDPTRLMAKLRAVQERGYAVSDGDVDTMASSVGAPILDRTGYPIGAVSAAGPSSRLSPDVIEHCAQLVCAAAADISTRLGVMQEANGRDAEEVIP